MADRPSIGSTNWGTALNNHLAVSLETDGTLKTSAVAETFTPSAYAAEQSMTLPNGLVVKFGTDQINNGARFQWGSSFNNALMSVIVTPVTATYYIAVVDNSPAADVGGFTLITNAPNGNYFNWIAIGY